MARALSLRVSATALACAVMSAACASSDGSEQSSETTAPEQTPTSLLGGVLTATSDVLAGQCFNSVPDPVQQPYAVFIVPCDEAHEFEAYSKTNIELGTPQPAGAPYPGDIEVANATEAQCITGFASFVGVSWEVSEYDVQVWWPSAQSWQESNDRSILCAVYPVRGGTTTGSARNAQR